VKRIFFDLDDTLYKNKKLREDREKAIISFLGEKAEEYKELKKNNNTIKSLEILGISKETFYQIISSVPIELEKDERLIEILGRLFENFELLIISNSPEKIVEEIIKKLGIEKFFSKLITGDKMKKTKPHPTAFEEIKFGDTVVGNNFDKDLKIPKQIGAITILVSESPNSEADFNIHHIYEIDYIKLDKL